MFKLYFFILDKDNSVNSHLTVPFDSDKNEVHFGEHAASSIKRINMTIPLNKERLGEIRKKNEEKSEIHLQPARNSCVKVSVGREIP